MQPDCLENMAAITRKFISINLSNGKITTEPVDQTAIMDFIGGRGVGVSYLFRKMLSWIVIISFGVGQKTASRHVRSWKN
jgi:hypothetical protein